MEVSQSTVFVMIPTEDLETLKKTQQLILQELEYLRKQNGQRSGLIKEYLSPEQFMEMTNMKRWKFDQLVNESVIKTHKKKRKIYVPVSEVQRYITDPTIL